MRFGDEEWFEKLNEMASFPSIFAFYVSNEGHIFSSVLKSKAENIGNIKYSTFNPNDYYMYNGEDVALTDVIRLHSEQEYYEKCKRLMEIWNREEENS